VLPAGYVPAEARSALARSTQLRSTIEALAEQFDYLIFDIPAVAATSDTVALTSLASAVAIVVRQGVTPSNTVKMALDEVKHVPVLGVILNQVQIYTPRWILNLLPQE
jgi:Mrp family chromosome partitioning ATPase